MLELLKTKWGKFLGVIFGPGSMLFVLLTVVSLILAFLFKTNILFATLLSVLGSIFAGIAGSFIKEDYSRLSSENVLEKKGRSALRNIQVIEQQIRNVRNWISLFNKSKGVAIVGKRILEEIDRHLSTMQLNIQSGLADWVDVVPELQENQERVVELDKKQKEVLQSYMVELLEKRRELISSKDEQKMGALKKLISNLEKQIKDLQVEQSHVVGGIVVGGSGISASGVGFGDSPIYWSGVGGSLHTNVSQSRSCQKCGRLFEPIYGRLTTTEENLYCSTCRNKLPGIPLTQS